MYSELIYTRCNEGIDLLRDRNILNNSGFKVYSSSENITSNGVVDLQLLHNTYQCKMPYSDPSFMDDAYLFVVPDLGGKIFMNFHPIPFDREATGNYSHRPGNIINQVFVGEFGDFYPYELFGDYTVWDAQIKGEAYYYDNKPVPLATREDICHAANHILFNDISSFIMDGRRNALKSCIAFIISQYSLPAEKRRYLVIKDENSKMIELWIAAIQSAFSPRISCCISFATRMDKFISSNRYTVNPEGRFEPQINLQNPNQKLRLRAMIVGVDERDRTNVSLARAQANSPFVVLDGKTKSLSMSIDTSDAYYDYVTAFNEAHKQFCSAYMQMFDLSIPSGDVINLYSAFSCLDKYFSDKRLIDLLSGLEIIKRYRLVKNPFLENLYREIKQSIPVLLKENASSAIAVIEWLKSVAAIVGDSSAVVEFKHIICRTYAESVFLYPQKESTRELHGLIRNGLFAREVAEYITSQNIVSFYSNALKNYSPKDWLSFAEYYVENIRKTVNTAASLEAIILQGLQALYYAKDDKAAMEFAKVFYQLDPNNVENILLNDAARSTDPYYSSLVVKIICYIDSSILSSERRFSEFVESLLSSSLKICVPLVLAYKAKMLENLIDIDRFYYWLITDNQIKSMDLSQATSIIDKKLVLSDKSAIRLATNIQATRPQGLACTRSAHIYALSSLEDPLIGEKLIPILNNASIQGFPSIEDDVYAERLVKRLLSAHLKDDVMISVLSSASKSLYYCDKIAKEVVIHSGSKDSSLNTFFIAASQVNSEYLFNKLVLAFSETKSFDKVIISARNSIQSSDGKQYFELVEKNSRELFEQKKKTSLFGRIGNFFSKEQTNNKDENQ